MKSCNLLSARFPWLTKWPLLVPLFFITGLSFWYFVVNLLDMLVYTPECSCRGKPLPFWAPACGGCMQLSVLRNCPGRTSARCRGQSPCAIALAKERGRENEKFNSINQSKGDTKINQFPQLHSSRHSFVTSSLGPVLSQCHTAL